MSFYRCVTWIVLFSCCLSSQECLALTEQNDYVCVEWINNDSKPWNKQKPWFSKNCFQRVSSAEEDPFGDDSCHLQNLLRVTLSCKFLWRISTTIFPFFLSPTLVRFQNKNCQMGLSTWFKKVKILLRHHYQKLLKGELSYFLLKINLLHEY